MACFKKSRIFDKKNMIKYRLAGIISLLIIAFTVYFSFYILIPNTISDENTPLEEFSTYRAFKHIEYISKEPHYVGSDYHKIVREYLIRELKDLGLEPEVQTKFSIDKRAHTASMVHNIMARIEGRGKGNAILLMAHYDSAPFSSMGASDNGVAIAVILEGIRTFLYEGGIHDNDIIILFSDAEEIGLLGAKAFVEDHPWCDNIALVLNFEARGTGGPAFALIETNWGNEMLVKSLAEASTPWPVANSFLYSVYKMLPNDTDLTVFRENADIDGFNFAFIDDFFDYHCSTDNIERLDLNTIEHHASYLMPMLNYLKNYDLAKLRSGREFVFFNFPYFGIIYYPYSWAFYMIGGISLLFLMIIIYAYLRKKIFFRPVLKSFLSIVLSIITGVILALFLWKLILVVNPHYTDILHGYPYNGHYYTAIVVFLTAAISTWIINRFCREIKTQEFLVAAIIIWIALAWALTLFMPGASFVVLPVFSISAILMLELAGKTKLFYRPLVYVLLVVPGLFILAPFTDMFPVGLNMKALPLSALIATMLVTILYPIFNYMPYKKTIHLYFFGLAIVFSMLALSNSGFDEEKPIHNSLNYVFYSDENMAVWETYNKVPDSWLNDIMSSGINEGSPFRFNRKSKYNRQITYHSEAPLIEIDQTVIITSLDTIIGDNRIVEFSIDPQRKLNYLELLVSQNIEFNSFEVNGRKFSENSLSFSEIRNRVLAYYFSEKDEKLLIGFSVNKTVIPEFILYEASNDLLENEELSVKSRPPNKIAMPFVLNDLIINVKTINWQ
jgi:hypothetical protein